MPSTRRFYRRDLYETESDVLEQLLHRPEDAPESMTALEVLAAGWSWPAAAVIDPQGCQPPTAIPRGCLRGVGHRRWWPEPHRSPLRGGDTPAGPPGSAGWSLLAHNIGVGDAFDQALAPAPAGCGPELRFTVLAESVQRVGDAQALPPRRCGNPGHASPGWTGGLLPGSGRPRVTGGVRICCVHDGLGADA